MQGALPDAFGLLKPYAGVWQIKTAGTPSPKPHILKNECAPLSKFYACGQSIDDSPSGLVIFIPQGDNGHYKVQTVLPEGRATGLTELNISGSQWVYTTRQHDAQGTRWYRTINTFGGNNKIHFEHAESSDGQKWDTKSSGDEVRLSAAEKQR